MDFGGNDLGLGVLGDNYNPALALVQEFLPRRQENHLYVDSVVDFFELYEHIEKEVTKTIISGDNLEAFFENDMDDFLRWCIFTGIDCPFNYIAELTCCNWTWYVRLVLPIHFFRCFKPRINT